MGAAARQPPRNSRGGGAGQAPAAPRGAGPHHRHPSAAAAAALQHLRGHPLSGDAGAGKVPLGPAVGATAAALWSRSRHDGETGEQLGEGGAGASSPPSSEAELRLQREIQVLEASLEHLKQPHVWPAEHDERGDDDVHAGAHDVWR